MRIRERSAPVLIVILTGRVEFTRSSHETKPFRVYRIGKYWYDGKTSVKHSLPGDAIAKHYARYYIYDRVSFLSKNGVIDADSYTLNYLPARPPRGSI